jgi:hypothetical protein
MSQHIGHEQHLVYRGRIYEKVRGDQATQRCCIKMRSRKSTEGPVL